MADFSFAGLFVYCEKQWQNASADCEKGVKRVLCLMPSPKTQLR
jgi:hypothetical protein